MWPFKKIKILTPEEFAATFPPAPCGEQTTHYEWTELQEMPCPVCTVQKKNRQEEAKMDRLADKIADRVLSAINKHNPHSTL